MWHLKVNNELATSANIAMVITKHFANQQDSEGWKRVIGEI